jgi:hypothetical protein
LTLELADPAVLAQALPTQNSVSLEPAVDMPATTPTPREIAVEARVVPVLTPSERPPMLAWRAHVTQHVAELDAAVDTGRAEVERAPEHGTVARLVPVLTPSPRDEQADLADSTLRAVASAAALGAFGGPSAPTTPLPGRASRRTAFALTETNEDQPGAG